MVVRGDEALQSRRRAEIEVIANTFRDTLGLAEQRRLPGVQLFERLDELVVPVDQIEIGVDWGVRELDDGVLACSQYCPLTSTIDVFLTPDTYQQLRRGDPRALFTLAHECGHVVLHPKELIARALHPLKPSLNRRAEHPFYRDTEWQGDTFAAAFIAPLNDVLRLHDEIGYLSPTGIAQTFGLSRQAAEIRIDNILELVPRRPLRVVGHDLRRRRNDWED